MGSAFLFGLLPLPLLLLLLLLSLVRCLLLKQFKARRISGTHEESTHFGGSLNGSRRYLLVFISLV
jgi:hypothetical protein